MGKKLLIVESPAKAKTIGKYLGPEFTVKSSVGHIRDLPKENGAIRIDKTGDESWTFTPKYEISEGKEQGEGRLGTQVRRQVVERSLSRKRSRPRRGGDRVAPQGSARARRRQEAVPSRHLQRDHQERSSQGRCRAARHRHAARRRAAGAQDPRPHCRLQGVAAPLEEHRVRQQPLALRGPRASAR